MADYNFSDFGWFFLVMITILFLSVVAHETAHVVVAKAFGIETRIGYGIMTPIHVTVDDADNFSTAMIAIAGPLINLLIGIACHLSKSEREVVRIARNTNYMLFAINILPVPGFDGWSFLKNILRMYA